MIESFGPLEYSQFAASINAPEGFANLGELDPFGTIGWQPEQPWMEQVKHFFQKFPCSILLIIGSFKKKIKIATS